MSRAAATLAIDQGTTSTRAVRVDADGRAAVIRSLPNPSRHPAPRHVEQDPERLVADIRRCLAAADAAGAIEAVGIDNQGESCLAWDADTGRPLGPVIVWQDDRTRERVARLVADGAEPLVRERAGLPLDAYFSASKLGWIVRELPAARRLAARGRLRLGTTDAYFRERLTGRLETDVTTASRTSLMNLASREWDPELCRLFGVPIEALPPIGPSAGELGALDAGGRRVPLRASLVDQQASLYGHGCREPGEAKMTFGTGAFASVLSGPTPLADAVGVLPTVAWQLAGREPLYALDGGVHTAAGALDWAGSLGLWTERAAIDDFDGPSAVERALVFVPALAGLACPHWDRRARGSWMGLTPAHTSADLVRAVLEGVALRMAEVLAAIERHRPLEGPVPIDGGLTANGYFCRFLADALGRELIVSAEPELTAVGTAALAAEAGGGTVACRREGRRVAPGSLTAEAFATFAAARRAVQAFGEAVG